MATAADIHQFNDMNKLLDAPIVPPAPRGHPTHDENKDLIVM